MRIIIVSFLCYNLLGAEEIKKSRARRLTNDLKAEPGEFPYTASILRFGDHLCGAVLISKRHLVTAAHCIHDKDPGGYGSSIPVAELKIALGTVNLADRTTGQIIGVLRTSIHPNYTYTIVPDAGINDIGMITLKNPVKITDTVKPIALPFPLQEVPLNTPLIISGFGSRFLGDPMPMTTLRKMTLFTVSQQDCQNDWKHRYIYPTHLCARYKRGYTGCQGDSGGPLTMNGQVLIGIFSEGDDAGCGTGVADVFTKVSYFIDWIKSEMKPKLI
ncbi:hypothetical protein QAD02_009944 [Eretmocerus hayati]|uniref:Uncharacterized protein n=1 Tax=Eretmocerus hayati TaxID=131215 RepID=A0ACC2NBK6_9HYME|nr:hypothetical protein QAD02_009944 [Eretmocerus hayati]